MYITRLLEKSLEEAVKSFPAVFIGGPRRSVKTYQQTKIWENDFSVRDYVVRHSPSQATAFLNRGDALSAGLMDAAIADFDRAVTLDPRLSAAYVNRGNVFAQMGKTDFALADYHQAIQLDPRFAAVYAMRA